MAVAICLACCGDLGVVFPIFPVFWYSVRRMDMFEKTVCLENPVFNGMTSIVLCCMVTVNGDYV